MYVSHWKCLGTGALAVLIYSPLVSATPDFDFSQQRERGGEAGLFIASVSAEEGQSCSIALGLPEDNAISTETGQTFTWQGAACSSVRYTFEFTPFDDGRDTIVIENVRSPLTFGSGSPGQGSGQTLPSWAAMTGDAPAAEWRITADVSSAQTASVLRCLNLQGDLDGDGVLPCEGDCDNRDPYTYPDAAEIPYDGVDQDCDGSDLDDIDQDGEASVFAGGSDCDDLDPTISGAAEEIPYDGIDQDCDGDDLIDVDGDGEAAEAVGGGDCDDLNAEIYPGAYDNPEDGIDQDCDGSDAKANDETTADNDGDGFSTAGGDCDDSDPESFPGAYDYPDDGIDQDCDGYDASSLSDNGVQDDADGDGYTVEGGDCNDFDWTINPGAYDSEGDGIDANCDGVDGYLEYPDEDGDGWSWYDGDCNDADPSTYPGAYDYPGDGYDADCDGMD